MLQLLDSLKKIITFKNILPTFTNFLNTVSGLLCLLQHSDIHFLMSNLLCIYHGLQRIPNCRKKRVCTSISVSFVFS